MLQDQLGPLQHPFEKDAIHRLLEQSKRETAGPDLVRELKARLAIAYLPAQARIAVWQAVVDLQRRLQQRTFQLDEEGVSPAEPIFPPPTLKAGSAPNANARLCVPGWLWGCSGWQGSGRRCEGRWKRPNPMAFQPKAPAGSDLRSGRPSSASMDRSICGAAAAA